MSRNMKQALEAFYHFLSQPIALSARTILALLIIPLCLTFTAPLWRLHLLAPQYPTGLDLYIFAYKVEGGNEGRDITEINTLNHYIGMAPIDRQQLADLDWIPFALGALVILTLRVAAIGSVRDLVDLLVIAGYFSLFAFGRFAYKLYYLGHNLDPKAPVTVEPFTPAIIGTKQVANFTVTSVPSVASIYLAVFMTVLVGVTLWQLIRGRMEAKRSGKLGPAAA